MRLARTSYRQDKPMSIENDNSKDELPDLEPVREEKDGGGGGMLTKVLGLISIVSFLLNCYLVYDKFHEKEISQPGPVIYRIAMTGLQTSVFSILSSSDAFKSNIPHPWFAETAIWKQIRQAGAGKDPIVLRDESYRFLALQNVTKSAYSPITLRPSAGAPLQLGTLNPDSTVLIAYDKDEEIDNANISFKVMGDSSDRTVTVPPKSANGVELLAGVSAGLIEKFGSLQGKDDRLDGLIRALPRSPTQP
jgi:hypothetical protein